MLKNNSPKIVLVDDDTCCLSIYEQEILNLGFKDVKTYSSGKELLENLESELEKILLDLKRQNNYNVQAEIPRDLLNKTVPAKVQHQFIRIIQEITNNMVKYAPQKMLK